VGAETTRHLAHIRASGSFRQEQLESYLRQRFARSCRVQSSLVGGNCASHTDGLHIDAAWIHGETTVGSFEAEVIRPGPLFAANHPSTSDRSHPPETCLPGNRPLFVQRKRVDRLTPTTRRTSVVLILWSSGANRSGLGPSVTAGRGARTEAPHGPKRRGSCRGRAAPSRLA
jgi:hypothetical protein